MEDTQKLELETLMKTADKRPRPVLLYKGMTPGEFVSVCLYGRFVEIFSVALVKLGADRTWPDEREWQECCNLSGALHDGIIFALAERYYEPGLFWVLAERMCEQTYVMEEFAKRVEKKDIGKHLLLIPWLLKTDGDLSRVDQILQVDKIKPYEKRQKDFTADDLKEEAREKVLTVMKTHANINPTALPRYPLQLHPDIQNLWDSWMAAAWKQGIEKSFGEIKAALTLDDETLKQKSRDHLRNLFETAERRDNILAGKENFPESGPENWRANQDFSDFASANRKEEIYNQVHSEIAGPEKYMQRIQDENEEDRRLNAAYEYASNRWGEEKGRIYLDTLSQEDGTVEKAARAVGVRREMGHRYKKELKMMLSKKKPQK
jgi:hypothetical protein